MFSSKGTIAEEEVDYPLTLAGDAGLHQMTYSQYEEKVENGDAFIVIIERAGCGYCVQYMPIVEDVANEKKIPIYYIDTDTLSQDEYTELSTTNNYYGVFDMNGPTDEYLSAFVVKDTLSEESLKYAGKMVDNEYERFVDVVSLATDDNSTNNEIGFNNC